HPPPTPPSPSLILTISLHHEDPLLRPSFSQPPHNELLALYTTTPRYPPTASDTIFLTEPC
ncbi:hypothetical protein A2U01_0087343, partial [Trifolium medium]|nr:hypothetical protein [Trifolium medium]